ncbi:hypothetical protein Trydic_g17171 [Trypoxylus dichotomus]
MLPFRCSPKGEPTRITGRSLSTISKVFETLLLARINDHLHEQRLQDDDQLGFRPGHLIAITVPDNGPWQNSLQQERGNSHDISEPRVGVRQDPKDRRFHAIVNDDRSSEGTMKSEVLQGSALGPALFAMYLGEIAGLEDLWVSNAIYVDDTPIVATSRYAEVAGELAQAHAAKIEEFLHT